MMTYFPCPAMLDGKHAFGNNYEPSHHYDHHGRELQLPVPKGMSDQHMPYVATSRCMHCTEWVISYNLNYPSSIRWDNRSTEVDPGAKGGWTWMYDTSMITAPITIIQEEPV